MKNSNFCKFFFFFIVTLLIINKGESQVLISTEIGSPDASAMLEIYSKSKGLLIPRMSTGEIGNITDPAEGLLVYDLTLNSFFLRGSTGWINLSSSAEIWQQNTTDVYLNNLNKNVGIGTTSPDTKLDVYDFNPVSSTVGDYRLLAQFGGNAHTTTNNAVYETHWLIRDAAGTNWYTSRIHNALSVDASFRTPWVDTKTWWERDPLNNIQSWGNAGETYLTINSGNVGIGTTTPNAILEVNGTDNSVYGWVGQFLTPTLSNENGALLLLGKAAVSSESAWMKYKYSDTEADRLLGWGHFGSSEQMVLTRYGNVGIGTTTPDYKLDVNGSIVSRVPTAFRLRHSTYSAFLRNDNSHFFLLFTNPNDPDGSWNDLRPFIVNLSNGNTAIAGSAIYAVNGGNVGIGTTTPDTKLEINGQVKITGGTPGENKVLTSNADGLASWETITDDLGNNYGTVVNPATGQIWLDRNLGASRVAQYSHDSQAYGDLYQWGRAQEGHEKKKSAIVAGPVSSWIADEGSNTWDEKFITNSSSPYDWLSTAKDDLWSGRSAENNPCPCGFRIPTNAEWNQERRTWATQDRAGAFGSPLKLTTGGRRYYNSGSWDGGATYGYYWSSTVSSISARYIYFFDAGAGLMSDYRTMGMSIRCIKD